MYLLISYTLIIQAFDTAVYILVAYSLHVTPHLKKKLYNVTVIDIKITICTSKLSPLSTCFLSSTAFMRIPVEIVMSSTDLLTVWSTSSLSPLDNFFHLFKFHQIPILFLITYSCCFKR